MADEGIPEAVRAAWGLGDAEAEPIASGWINRTYRVARGAETIIVQRLHPIFRAEVNADIDAITRHLVAKGLPTPRIVPNEEGALHLEADGVWRALTYLPGQTLDALDAPRARSAGALVGRFHRAVADLEHRFAFTRPGAHDTPAHLAKLRGLRAASPGDAEADALADAVLALADDLPTLGDLPSRIIHGDLKATNLRFDHAGEVAVALLDLDTLQHGTLAIEMGDALRSWCNPTDEADPAAAFDAAIFAAAMEGWLRGVGNAVTEAEARAVAPGIETIAVELASRFAADVYEDRYFGWDPTRFESRRAHNVARTRGQASLARSIRAQREALLTTVDRLLG